LLDRLFAHPAGYSDTNRPLTLPAAYCAKIEFFRSLLDGLTKDKTMKSTALSCMPGMLVLLSACANYQVVPDHLEDRIQKDLSFEQVEQNPEAYEGRTVMWGGKVLDVMQTTGNTRVEIMQVPLDRVFRPLDAPTASRGRFMAIDTNHEMKDPAALQKDALVTVIGEVRGRVKATLDEGRYEYPTIVIKDMTAWEKQPGITHFPPGSQFKGFRPFIFWDSRRVVGKE
jgi:outer membrane lipoprotein